MKTENNYFKPESTTANQNNKHKLETSQLFKQILGTIISFAALLGILISCTGIVLNFIQLKPNAFLNHPFPYLRGTIAHLCSPGAADIVLICIGLALIIPFFLILFIGTKLIFNYQSKTKQIVILSLIIWLLALISGFMIPGISSHQTKISAQVNSEQNIQSTSQQKVLYICRSTRQAQPHQLVLANIQKLNLIHQDTCYFWLGKPEIKLVSSSNSQTKILILKQAKGKTQQKAQNYANAIRISVNQQDSLLNIPEFYKLPDTGYHNQNCQIIIEIPQGTTIYLDKSLKGSIDQDSVNFNGKPLHHIYGKFWIRTIEGFKQNRVLTKKQSITNRTQA